MIIGSNSGWLMFAGMMARPRATSSRTNSESDMLGRKKRRKSCPGCWRTRTSRRFRNELFAALIFAYGDELHFWGNDAETSIVHLRDIYPCFGTARVALQIKTHFRKLRVCESLSAIGRSWTGKSFGVIALIDPFLAQRRQTRPDIDFYFRIGVRSGSVVNINRRIFFRAHAGRGLGLADFAHGNTDIGAGAAYIRLTGIRQGFDRPFVHVRGLA